MKRFLEGQGYSSFVFQSWQMFNSIENWDLPPKLYDESLLQNILFS